MKNEKCWRETPGVYTAKATNMDLVNAEGGEIGCYHAANMTAAFLHNFPFSDRGADASPRWAPTFAGIPVTALHFNGGCKMLLCSKPVCANLWDASGPLVLAPDALQAVSNCCPKPRADAVRKQKK